STRSWPRSGARRRAFSMTRRSTERSRMASSNSSKRARPRSLARYMAASASLSRAAGRSSASAALAVPTPQVAKAAPQRPASEAVEEQRPVGQLGERVVEGLMGEAFLSPLALDDGAEMAGNGSDEVEDALVVVAPRHMEELEDGDDFPVGKDGHRHPDLQRGG